MKVIHLYIYRKVNSPKPHIKHFNTDISILYLACFGCKSWTVIKKLTSHCRYSHIACGQKRFLAYWFIGISRHWSFFVSGISSSLRPTLLWREQALLMLPTELIRSSVYISLTSPRRVCPVSCSLSDTSSTRALTLEESCSHDWTWLTLWMKH